VLRSHKARSVIGMLDRAEASGALIRNSGATIIEKTGGNLGVALAIEAPRRGYNVELVVGLSFSQKKRDLLRQLSAKLIGLDMLQAGAAPAEVINSVLLASDSHEKKYVFLDQFADAGSIYGHMDSLAPEAEHQLQAVGLDSSFVLHLIVGTGTGASAQALKTYFNNRGYKTYLHIVQPESCDIAKCVFADHSLQGISVGRVPPFLDLDQVDSYIAISDSEAERGRQVLLCNFGILCGFSSGANFTAMNKFLSRHPIGDKEVILSLLYDRGEDY